MSIELLIYVADLADRVVGIELFAVLAIIGSAVVGGVLLLESDGKPTELVGTCKKVSGISAIVLVICFLIPSQKTIYMMAGASIGRDVVQSDIAIKVKKIIESKLNDYVKELEKKDE